MRMLLIFCFSFLIQALFARIHEVKHFNNIHQYVKPNYLVLLDLDNTLLEPAQTMGSDQWFRYRIKKHTSSGMNKLDALEKALSEWMAVQNMTQVKAVESSTPLEVAKLQRRDDICVMGLTTRGLGMSTRTIEQLARLSMHLDYSAPTKEEIHFMNGRGVLYRKGILFTAATDKGAALFKLLDDIKYTPTGILFINDKKDNLLDVEKDCIKREIPFIGLRYSFVDEKVANFDVELVQIQEEHFGYILSDAEAKKQLQEKKVM